MSNLDDGELMYVEAINDAIKAYHNGTSLGALEIEPLVGGNRVIICIACKPSDPDAPCPTIYKGIDGKWVHETPPSVDVIEGEIVEP